MFNTLIVHPMSDKKSMDNTKGMCECPGGKPSLFKVCVLLENRRNPRVPHCVSDSSHGEFQRLIGSEDFETLVEAKQAIENGYFEFLANLNIVCWFLTHEAEDVAHVEGLTKKEIEAIERKHKKQLAEIEYPTEAMRIEIEARAARDKEMLPTRIRRTRSDTDLPTKQMIEDVMKAVFPEQGRWFPSGKNPSPTTAAKIWRDAGLSWVPKSTTGISHPNLKKRIDSLKIWLETTFPRGG